jgi:hypothetical protein
LGDERSMLKSSWNTKYYLIVPNCCDHLVTEVVWHVLVLCRTNVVGGRGSKHPVHCDALDRVWTPWGRRCFVRWVVFWYRVFSRWLLDSCIRTFYCMFSGLRWDVSKINCLFVIHIFFFETTCLWYISEVIESSLSLQPLLYVCAQASCPLEKGLILGGKVLCCSILFRRHWIFHSTPFINISLSPSFWRPA